METVKITLTMGGLALIRDNLRIPAKMTRLEMQAGSDMEARAVDLLGANPAPAPELHPQRMSPKQFQEYDAEIVAWNREEIGVDLETSLLEAAKKTIDKAWDDGTIGCSHAAGHLMKALDLVDPKR